MRALVALLLVGCADNTQLVAPVIDLPANDSASAFPLDEVVLSVAHAGATGDLVSQTFEAGSVIELPGVPFGDDLVIHMTGKIGSSEIAYGRTCPLVLAADAVAPAPHLYFAREVKFGELGLTLLPEQRSGGVAVTDVDGSGLIFGGVDPSSGEPIGEIERFDPMSGELRLVAVPPEVTPRTGAVAARLGVGGDARVALIGGTDTSTDKGATFAELIEASAPSGRRVERIDDASMARTDLSATALTDGRIVTIGGLDDAGTASAAVQIISIASGATTVRTLRAMNSLPRYGHTATRLGDDVGAPVLVAGGFSAPGTFAPNAELFKPTKEDFTGVSFVAPMVHPRSHHDAVLMPDGSVLIIGGVGMVDATTIGPVATMELFTLDGGFQAVTDLPVNAGLIDFAATPLPDGRVLITGGRRCADATVCAALDTAFIARVDPIDGTVDVDPTDHMAVKRTGHTATLLCDGTVLISGGTADFAPPERYNPPALGRR
ncbi:MAG: hypothetical protein ABI678_09590 [Kofleriaceae bacterium]